MNSGIHSQKTPHQFCEGSMVEIEELSHDEIQRIVSEAGAEAVKKAFEANGIRIPYAQIVVHNA